jgi:ATP diphosphatase
MITPSRDISRLLEIMALLRDPEKGCPWDKEQDFRSIAPYTIEEACEVADAIERDDMADLKLELGDLLLQSVYHSRMAEEGGYFDFGDVVEGITKKMIRRHPHVFGTEDASAEEYSAKGLAGGTWERIKAEEKAELAAERKAANPAQYQEKAGSLLDDVPGTLPTLACALKLQKKASKVGFDWNDPHAVFSKIREELDELEAEIESGCSSEQEAELGDILFAVANLARHLRIDPDSALRRTNQKFRNRFAYIEQNIERTGETMQSANLETMDMLWNEAKIKLRRD